MLFTKNEGARSVAARMLHGVRPALRSEEEALFQTDRNQKAGDAFNIK